jgi:UDP-GlcNAc:undecaprenyl-phosphate GlcNAc-1-phosphate transferase
MTYPLIFTPILIILALVSFALTGVFYWLAKRKEILPAVRDRDVHSVRKPRLGGLAMWSTAMLSFLIISWSPWSSALDFHRPGWLGIDQALWGIMAGLLVILLFGLWDDLRGLNAWQQLVGQFLASLMLVVFGIGVLFIRLPSGHVLRLDNVVWSSIHLVGGGPFILWSSIFTMLWVMTMINVMNFFDGLDGLAGSVAMTAAVVLIFVSLRVGFLGTATLALVLLGSVAGFLPWNWYPSKLFMGTVGSQMLGFLLAVIAIISGGKLATAVLVLGVPLFDAIVVVLRRILAGKNPFKADQRHLHHRLLKIGIPVPWAVILIDLVAIVFGSLAVVTQQSNQKGILTFVLAVCILLFIGITFLMEKKRGIVS